MSDARAIGADESFDPELVHVVYERLAPRADAWRSAGIFTAPVPVPAGAAELTRLLAVTGRRYERATGP